MCSARAASRANWVPTNLHSMPMVLVFLILSSWAEKLWNKGSCVNCVFVCVVSVVSLKKMIRQSLATSPTSILVDLEKGAATKREMFACSLL